MRETTGRETTEAAKAGRRQLWPVRRLSPGPWALRPDGHLLEVVDAGGLCLALLQDYAEVNGPCMAAAPELCRALTASALLLHAQHLGPLASCDDAVCSANSAALARAREVLT